VLDLHSVSTKEGHLMRSRIRSPRRRRQQQNPGRQARSFAPLLEQLEARCLLSVNTSTHVAGPNIDVSNNQAGYQGETTIAINPTNPQNMIAGANNLGSGGVTQSYFTTNGGTTWTGVNLGGNGDPGVVFDQFGNAYFSMIDSSDGISVAKSTDGGATWGAPVQVAAPTDGLQDKPYIAAGVDALNPSLARIYVGWDDNGAGDVLKVASSNDGITWTAPVAVDGHIDETYAQPGVGPNGQFYVAWDNFSVANKDTIMFSSSLDDGATFSAPVAAATSTVNVFNPRAYTIPAQPTRGIGSNPAIAVEDGAFNTGRIYLTFTSAPTSHNDTNVYLVASDNGGATWTALGSSPVKINTDTTTTSQFFSDIGIDPTNGTVNLSWYDARNDKKNDQKVDVYFQSFTSAGVRSGSNVKVTTAQSDESNRTTNNANQYGDYEGIAASGGFAFPIWTDHRNSSVRNSEEIFVDPPLGISETAGLAAPAAERQDTALVSPAPAGRIAFAPVSDAGRQALLAAVLSGESQAAVAPATGSTPAPAAVSRPADFSVTPPVSAAPGLHAGNSAALTDADAPLFDLPAPVLGREVTPPVLLPAADDLAGMPVDSDLLVSPQSSDAVFAGESQEGTAAETDQPAPVSFHGGPAAAVYLTVVAAGLTVAAGRDKKERKGLGSRARMTVID
jgi:hypothetical protein